MPGNWVRSSSRLAIAASAIRKQPALCSITALFKARFQGLKGMGAQVTA